MSLCVDLMTPEERRSGSTISIQSVVRIGAILLPTLVVFAIVHQVINAMLVSSELRVLESRWEAAEPKQEHSLKLAGRLRYNEKTAKELEAWRANRIAWNQQIKAIIETAPATIQATSLVIGLDDKDTPQSPPVRHFSLTVEGKTSGEQAMQVVGAFEQELETHPATLELLDRVEVANYAADNPRSRLAISPDLVATAVSLANARLQLRLYNRQGQLIDLADDGRGTPLAGDARLKRSMVRIAFDQDGSLPASWAIAQEASGWDAESSELGTPGLIPAYLEPVSPERPGTPVHSISWAELKNRP